MTTMTERFMISESSTRSVVSLLRFVARCVFSAMTNTVGTPILVALAVVAVILYHSGYIDSAVFQKMLTPPLNLLITYPLLVIAEEMSHCLLCIKLSNDQAPISLQGLTIQYYSTGVGRVRLFVRTAHVNFEGKALPSNLIKIFGSPSLLILATTLGSSVVVLLFLLRGQLSFTEARLIFVYFLALPLLVSALNLVPAELVTSDCDGLKVMKYSKLGRIGWKKIPAHLAGGCMILVRGFMGLK